MTQPLTDAEIDRIMEAAWALHPSQRGAFEQTVITELQRLPPAARGPGTLHRIIAPAQRIYLRSSRARWPLVSATKANTRCGPKNGSNKQPGGF
jgi:hypothetical protein